MLKGQPWSCCHPFETWMTDHLTKLTAMNCNGLQLKWRNEHCSKAIYWLKVLFIKTGLLAQYEICSRRVFWANLTYPVIHSSPEWMTQHRVVFQPASNQQVRHLVWHLKVGVLSFVMAIRDNLNVLVKIKYLILIHFHVTCSIFIALNILAFIATIKDW